PGRGQSQFEAEACGPAELMDGRNDILNARIAGYERTSRGICWRTIEVETRVTVARYVSFVVRPRATRLAVKHDAIPGVAHLAGRGCHPSHVIIAIHFAGSAEVVGVRD